MASLLRMPAPAAGVADALLLEWALEEKAAFAVSDVLAVIETDKAVIEIEAESDGLLHRQLIQAGRRVDVGTPIAVIGSDADSAADIDALVSQAGVPVATGGDGATRVGATSDEATGVGATSDEATGVGAAGDEAPGHVATAASATGGGASNNATGGENLSGAPSSAPARIFASPIARRMARDAGLGLAELTGTGPGGRIVRRDVEAAMAARDHGSAAGTPSTPATPVTATTPSPESGAYTDRPHSRIRTAIAARLTESKQTVPHFYLRAAPRVDDLLAMRGELNAGGGPKVSVNDLVVRAVARAHRIVPEMNVTYTDTAVRLYHTVDVAVAIATDDGLVTPVIRNADRLAVSEIAAATADLAERARNGRLRQQELEGGSITVTNLGMFAVEEFAAIINPPQSAILAVGAARREPVVDGEQLVAATVMHLTLSVDHRPLDGVVAARWMAALTDLLEHPVRILA